MINPVEIFRMNADGSMLWQGAAATIEDAKARVRELAARSPSQYVILDRQTETKFVIDGDSNGESLPVEAVE